MTVRPLRLALVLALLAVPAARLAHAGDDEKKAEKPPKTEEVKKGPFTAVLELDGTFVPRDALEVDYEPKVYGGKLEVKDAAHTGPVTEGQALVVFDDEDLQDQIAKAERDLDIARVKLERQRDETQRRQDATEIALEQAKRRSDRAQQSLELFRTVDKPIRIAQAEQGLQSWEDSIHDQEEEYQQLQKMYQADDLVEETEEIVLRRSKRRLDRARESLGWARQRNQTFLQVTLPHEEADLELDARKQKQDLDAARVSADETLRQGKLELAKAEAAFADQEKALADLHADQKALTVRAPAAGFAVPGFFRDGKWQKVDETRHQLDSGGRLGARQPLFTIFKPGNMDVVVEVDEDDLLRVKPAMAAEVRPAIDDTKVLPARVASILPVGNGGKLEVRLELEESHERLMPGYAGKVRIVLSHEDQARTVPATAVKKEKEGGGAKVWVWKDGEAQARDVKVGDTSEGRTRILEGVEAGESVLVRPPKEE
jgi:HlyD family secretion protein